MSKPDVSVRVVRLRVKDKHAPALSTLARETNLVWNYCNELSFKHWDRKREFLSGYDMQKYLTGATKEGLALHSQSVQAIAEEFAIRRRQARKTRLAWRKSSGARRSLGWIPFKKSAIEYRNDQIRYGKLWLSLWDSYGLKDYDLGAGSLSEDSRGRWYINLTVKVARKLGTAATTAIGIDLGLKDFTATSEGVVIEAKRFYRDLEPALAVAQRAGKKHRVKAIHAKIANRRNDFLHKLSTSLADEHGAIFVGNVNAANLAKTKAAKSVLDSGWSAFRTMLSYKCADAGVWFDEVDEAFSTQTCSCCGSRTGPKGLKDLGIRDWTCSECGSSHHRDINAARNILAVGHDRLAGGIPFRSEQGGCQATHNVDNRRLQFLGVTQ